MISSLRNFIIILYSILIADNVFAQCRIATSTIRTQIERMATWLAWIVITWSALSLVFAAYRFVMSEGDPGEVARIKKMIIFIFLGNGFVLAVWQVIKIITGC